MKSLLFITSSILLIWSPTSSEYTRELNKGNVETTLASNDIVFVNFYANWCRFSQMLKPIFEEAAQVVQQEFITEGQVVLAAVDCDREPEISQKYHISKYPTLKLFRNGRLAKREYRGQRSKDAFVQFIRDQLVDPVVQLPNPAEIPKLNDKKRSIIGFFRDTTSNEYSVFKRVAGALRDDCAFHAGIGDNFRNELTTGESIMFRPSKTSGDEDMLFMGTLGNFELLHTWSLDKCVPLVREITFENGEELTEEGIPFLILFHHPDDVDTVRQYNEIISRELMQEKGNVNFLTADGTKFTHPLHHLNKSPKDLPLIAIDSFRHMYLFPDMSKLTEPRRLLQFVQDLHNGKLHREFHHGPDPVTQLSVDGGGAANVHVQGGGPADKPGGKNTDPPESTFKNLKPSEHRYTILRDEL